MKAKTFFLGSYTQIEECLKYIDKIGIKANARVDISETEVNESPPTTHEQWNAFNLWTRMLAVALNDAGYTFGDGVLIQVPVPYTRDNIMHSVVDKFVAQTIEGHETATKALTIEDIQFIYKHIDAVCSERTGVHVEFPRKKEND